MSEWISIEDRAPDEDSLVVVAAFLYGCWNEPDACVCNFYNGKFVLNTDGLEAENYDGGAVVKMTFTPTHWLPLPTPPKEI